MNIFQNYEKLNMFECYIESNKNKDAALDLYFERYPERQQPEKQIFQRLYHNLSEYGSFVKPRSKNYNKENRERDEINTLACVAADPTISSRNIEKDVGTSKSKILKTLKKHRYKPYKIRKVHNLHPGDEERRLEFCHWYLQQINRNPNFFQNIIWTDEAFISSEGIFNRHNNRYWSNINPHQTVARIQQGRFGFHVWVALYQNRVLNYNIFNENLNAQGYMQILEECVIMELDNMPLATRNLVYFQQDGAPAHNSHMVRQLLNVNFAENWLGTYGPNRWPPRSPDLTPLDFYFWGFIKNEIYKIRSNTLEELRANFINCIRRVPNIHIFNATRSVTSRVQKCIEQNGRQFEHLL